MFVSKLVLLLPPLIFGAERLGSSHSNTEVVGDPLTFDVLSDEPIDRRALEEEALINGSDGINEFKLKPSDSIEGQVEFDLGYFDSTHASADGVEFTLDSSHSFSEDGMKIFDESKVAMKPIARKLRKIGVDIDISKKESHRDEFILLVRIVYGLSALTCNFTNDHALIMCAYADASLTSFSWIHHPPTSKLNEVFLQLPAVGTRNISRLISLQTTTGSKQAGL